MEKVIELLLGILAKVGVDEETANAVVQELDSALKTAEEDQSKDSDPAQDTPNDDVDQLPPAPPAEEGASETPSADLPPEDTASEDNGEQSVPPEVPTQDVPPVPPFDPAPLLARLDEQEGIITELKKANEGLLARVDSLEQALKNSGVIDENSTTGEVGSVLPTTAPQSPTDDVFSDVLRELNGKR